MMLIRPITEKDTEAFIDIAFKAGIGMTSMPKNREILEKRVKDAAKAFADPLSVPDSQIYLFVLEDLKTGLIGGTCAITAKTGRQSPLAFYRLKKQEVHTGIGSSIKIVPTLHVVYHKNYWSEIGSLYLTEQHRKSSLGRLLSLSRFLFIAAFPKCFDSKIFAEMRGYVDEHQNSPFWEGIGRHFVDTKFETLVQLRDEGIIDLSQALPQNPIYIELLPKNVQESIGKIHEETKAALKILMEEGFKFSDEFDICDGGPKIEIETKNIRVIRTSLVEKIADITNETLTTPPLILSNNCLNFKACLSSIKKLPTGGLAIPFEAAHALELNVGDSIRYASPYKESKA